MISVASSPLRPATTGVATCLPLRRTVTCAFAPLPVTAVVGTCSALSRSAVTTSTSAVMPGFSLAFVPSSANVTL